MPRIWRTVDGRHVLDGHPDAAFLAFADGDEPPAGVLAEVEGKRSPRLADKQAPKPADKAGSGSGLRVETRESLIHEAEDAGVTVDRRWGVDRLRDEIAKAQSED